MQITINKSLAIVLLFCLGACDPQLPTLPSSSVPASPTASGSAKALSDPEYQSLSNEQKYIVANKLLGTLYKGVPVSDFFKFTRELLPLKLTKEEDFLSRIQATLSQPLSTSTKTEYLTRIEEQYTFNLQSKPILYPLAMLFEFPLSRDFLNRWAAYKLANTILFSPAKELDSVGFPDIQAINYRLVTMMDDKKSIREMVYEHFISQENWRRFRSPEDNVREMIEVFLGLFDKDEDVAKGAIACKNWYLTDANQGFQLIVGFDENGETQAVLDTGIVNCYDFYRVVSQHPLLIPRITTVLVNTFFMGLPADKTLSIINAITAANPTTFQEIFLMMLFSKEYLLNVERPKEFEETFFNIAGRIDWKPSQWIFSNLASTDGNSTFPTMKNMGQAPFTYKLGRFPEIPQDTIGFAYYHKAVREQLLIDQNNPFAEGDGGWKSNFIEVRLAGNDFINYLFLSVVSRQATEEELSVLTGLIVDKKIQENKSEKARIVLDYLSRLPETYYFKAVR